MGTNRYLIELCSCLYLNIMCKNVLLAYARSNPLPVVDCFKQVFCILHQSCFASSASILHLVTSFVTVHYLSLLWLLFPYICPFFFRAFFYLTFDMLLYGELFSGNPNHNSNFFVGIWYTHANRYWYHKWKLVWIQFCPMMHWCQCILPCRCCLLQPLPAGHICWCHYSLLSCLLQYLPAVHHYH